MDNTKGNLDEWTFKKEKKLKKSETDCTEDFENLLP